MSQSTIDRAAPTTPVGLAPIHVEHLEWCAGDCHTTVARDGLREVVHNADVFEVELRDPREVVRLDDESGVDYEGDVAEKYWPLRSHTAVVALVKFDEFAADGTHTSKDIDVVLDGPEGVMSLTPTEAARLGAALIRAAARAR